MTVPGGGIKPWETSVLEGNDSTDCVRLGVASPPGGGAGL